MPAASPQAKTDPNPAESPQAKTTPPEPPKARTESPWPQFKEGDATAVTPIPARAPTTSTTSTAQTGTPRNERDDLRRRRGRRGRRVHRVVRRIELWSVLKLSLVLYTCLYLAVLATLVLIWGVAYSSGQIENLQSFLSDVGLQNYRFYGDQMFRACAAIGAVGVLAGTVLTVLTAALINVISETTGGIRLVVIEEEAPSRR